MKQKALEKRTALLQATLTLINTNGFHNTPIAKIAKIANVSPATMYLYFDNKQDLINQLYLEVKADFCDFMFNGYNDKQPVKKAFEYIWYNIAVYKTSHDAQAMFLAQCDNSPIIDEEIVEQGILLLSPLLELWKRGQEEGIIKPVSLYYLYAYTVYPLNFLLTSKRKGSCDFDKTLFKETFQITWDSIKI